LNAGTNDFARFGEARDQALRRTAWLLTGDWGLAEDLVQTALARAWPRWERINRRDDPEVYVRRVIVTATNTPGRPINVHGDASWIAVDPDGKTAYARGGTLFMKTDTITPISTATNTPGKPIRVRYGTPDGIVITP
jgi:Sigma-70 region 2